LLPSPLLSGQQYQTTQLIPRINGNNTMVASYTHPFLLVSLLLLAIASPSSSFSAEKLSTTAATKLANSAQWRTTARPVERRHNIILAASENNDMSSSDVDEYRNAPTAFLSNFMQSSDEAAADPLADIDFAAPKASKLPLSTLAAVLDAELYTKEWFVTGKVNPIYFDDAFQFQDPDVKLTGVEEYARGVIKIFDQATSRAEIISSVVNGTVDNTITITWRLSGRVSIGPKGLPIKPYICYTDFTIDEESGLITFQEDRFDIPGWDILLSALFPFLIGIVTKEASPELEPRVVEMPVLSGSGGGKKDGGIFGGLFQQLGL